jgi:hypothetical protein
VQVDTAALRSAAAELDAVGRDLDGAVKGLSAEVLGAGSPWGADEPGSLFGMAYVEVTEHALDVYSSMAVQLTDIAAGVRFMADGYDQTEQDNTAMFTDP